MLNHKGSLYKYAASIVIADFNFTIENYRILISQWKCIRAAKCIARGARREW